MDLYGLWENPDFVWVVSAVIIVLGIIFAAKKLKGLLKLGVIVVAVLLLSGVSLKTIYDEGSTVGKHLWGKEVSPVFEDNSIPEDAIGTLVRVHNGVLEVSPKQGVWIPLKGATIKEDGGKLTINGYPVVDDELKKIIQKVR